MKNFALVGVAGDIAPRHIKAIAQTGNNLLVAHDKHDSVGSLDATFPQCVFFKHFEPFDDFCFQQNKTDNPIDFLTICTPNYTHESLIRYGLRMGWDVICEKPLILNPAHLDDLKQEEKRSGKRVNVISQLRLHDKIKEVKSKIAAAPNKIYDVDLTYITARGSWYDASWKGNEAKSGGLAVNIGIHFYDLLQWLFGAVKKNVLHLKTADSVAGFLELEQARVRYFLSINAKLLPANASHTFYRSMTIDGQEIEFSNGFTDLHTESYKQILAGHGFGIDDARAGIEITHDIRQQQPIGLVGDFHPLAKKV